MSESTSQPLAMSHGTDVTSDISNSYSSVREVSRLLSSLEIRRTTGQGKQGENYDDDFENTVNVDKSSNADGKEDDKADAGNDDIGSLEEDYDDEFFEDDGSDE